jgi:hypothetical protein
MLPEAQQERLYRGGLSQEGGYGGQEAVQAHLQPEHGDGQGALSTRASYVKDVQCWKVRVLSVP